MMRYGMVIVGLFAAACVSEGTYDALEAERDLLAARVGELEGRIESLEAENERLTEQVEANSIQAKLVAETREALGVAGGDPLHATLQTELGDIRCELWPDVAPTTVRNFVELAEGTREWTDPRSGRKRTEPLYSGTVFHRVIPGFMIQGGDPLGTGTGGPGYRFEDETDPDVRFDEPGLLAMANSGPNTNGSQFFITDSEPRHLDGRHTIFGKCDLEIVRKIMAQPLLTGPRGEQSKPVDPVTLERVVVERG